MAADRGSARGVAAILTADLTIAICATTQMATAIQKSAVARLKLIEMANPRG